MRKRIRQLMAYGSLGILLATAQANSPDDVRPTPEERLTQAGIDLTIPSLTATLLDRNATTDVRYWSAVALGRTRNKTVLPSLLAAVDEPRADIRAGAVIGLRHLADPQSVDKLRVIVLKDPEPSVRQSAIAALESIGNDAAVEALIEVAQKSDETESIRVNALLATARIARPATRSTLKTLTDESSGDVKAAAAIALAASGEIGAVPGLVESILEPATPEWLRAESARRLEIVARKNFSYIGPDGKRVGENERADAVSEISRWWEANRSLYGH